MPPAATILLAIATRRVVASLCAGIFLGALIMAGGRPLPAVAATLEDHLWPSLTDETHLRVFAFTALMGALVGVIHRSAGMRGVVEMIAPLARGRRSGQLTTWALGLLIFFDDYANTLLLGGTLRPLTDRLGISRAKLAYLVDSTAAPVAGLAVVSTWIAGEIGFIQAGFADLLPPGQTVDGFQLFVASIPYRFYVLWALATVPLVALLRRDLPPMWQAELEAQRVLAKVTERAPQTPMDKPPEERLPARWHNAVLPVLIVLGVTCWLLVATGQPATGGSDQTLSSAGTDSPAAPSGLPVADKAAWTGWLAAFSQGNSYLALLYGSLAGLLTAMLWVRLQGLLSWAELRAAGLLGARQMLPALIILWLAWALSAQTDREQLGTGVYLGQLLEGRVSAPWLPSSVFLLASLVSFATGTSWGTMGILMPLVIRIVWEVLSAGGAAASLDDPLLLASVGSVLAGAVFGDHCSPISDTTILSSHASGCDHTEHVRTQLPYALLVASVSVLVGTLPAGYGVSPWLLLPAGVFVLVGALLLLGTRC